MQRLKKDVNKRGPVLPFLYELLYLLKNSIPISAVSRVRSLILPEKRLLGDECPYVGFETAVSCRLL